MPPLPTPFLLNFCEILVCDRATPVCADLLRGEMELCGHRRSVTVLTDQSEGTPSKFGKSNDVEETIFMSAHVCEFTTPGCKEGSWLGGQTHGIAQWTFLGQERNPTIFCGAPNEAEAHIRRDCHHPSQTLNHG